MQNRFSFSLTGADWWKQFLPYWLIILAIQAGTWLTRSGTPWAQAHPGLAIVVPLCLALVSWIAAMIFSVVFLAIAVPKISLAADAFNFRGRVGEFLALNVVGILLSAVTLFMFFPWYVRRISDYLASRTSFQGADFAFKGRGGRLFLVILLGVWAPLIVMVVLIVVLAGGQQHGAAAAPGSQLATSLITFAFVLFVLVVTLYLVYKWLIDLEWKDLRIRWETLFWPSFAMVLGQVALCIVTAAIYWPAAWLRLYRYFIGRTVATRNGTRAGRGGFDGDINRGFGLLWGQTLLTVVTLGFYAPWAYARVGRWLLESTYVETAS